MNLFLKGLIRGIILFAILILISLWNRFYGVVEYSNIFFFYSLIAFFLGVSSVVYEISQLSFLKRIFVHYIVMLFTVFPILLLSGFYQLNSFGDVIKVYFNFNEAGIFLFLSTFLIFKLREKIYYMRVSK
ncbi:DUF3021 family protein [Rossellomorea sp. YZS02]|uniref:DUF3021 family protein n=1 Tax=Rossellomorea sp. YZS02 TaxID=3097358 RepID=UPI0039B751F3